MLRYQFLCYLLKTLFFIKIALKLSYLSKKMQNFRALGAPPQEPRASGDWGLRSPDPQPPTAGVFAPSPHCEFLATRLVPFLVKTFFLLFT